MIKAEEEGFNNALIISTILHFFIIMLFIFGSPSFYETLPLEREIITFEMLPVSEIANVKTQTPKQLKEQEIEKAKKVLKTKPLPAEAALKNKDVPKEPEKAVGEEQVKNTKSVPGKTEPVIPQEKKPEKKVIVPKKEEKKKEPPKAKPDHSIDDILKTLEEPSEGDIINSNKTALKTSTDEGKSSKSDDYTNDLPQTIDEGTLIKQQIESNWHQQRFMGVARIQEVAVHVNISLDTSGKVFDVKIVNSKSHYPPGMADIWQNVAESVLQAVWNSSPFAKLEPSRYKSWSQLSLTFKPKL